YILSKYVRRHRAAFATAAAIGLATAAGIVVAFLQIDRARREAVAAHQQLEISQRDQALAQVDALLVAEPPAVPNIITTLGPVRELVDPRLRELLQNEQLSKAQRDRVRLA